MINIDKVSTKKVKTSERGQITKPFDPNDKATNEWLNAQKPATRANDSVGIRKVIKFIGMNGDQIQADRKADLDAKN